MGQRMEEQLLLEPVADLKDSSVVNGPFWAFDSYSWRVINAGIVWWWCYSPAILLRLFCRSLPLRSSWF